ncbi:predicted protein [Naegleria gruberi]|uniref:Predicted protein n=1 Tax=Naegleria gruberi TaxID=5762 RepID=D2VLS0_NAEGR|nr:uncharacterized protein NAEGRDRAFT_50609 [Naegleria gruberi]EFC42191.1 predicted protein [Naegleria gruberi]|eukprot:XP_002674935.1 predicted protein [Naegleria gruberi strain NEG-M]
MEVHEKLGTPPADIEEKARFYLEELLGFADEFEENKIGEFCRLLEEVEGNENLISSSIPHSVCEWIYYTNMIENVGPSSLEDTEKILNNQLDSSNEQEIEAVMITLSLLNETFRKENYKNKMISSVIFDESSLKKWFGIVIPNAKMEYRDHGSEASSYNGITHTYPKHTIVKSTTRLLCNDVYSLSQAITKCYPENCEKQLLYVFALAAFAQFHFVDIHPFPDGNGRLCRLISKRILDWCCPFPFPMFKNRDAYFQTLIEARKIEAKCAPKFLMSLLIDSAVDHYKSILETRYTIFPLVALSVEELEQHAKDTNMDKETLDKLREEFEKLDINGTVIVKINESKAYKLTRIETVDFETI